MQRIINQTHGIPGSTRTRIAESTLRDWIRAYHKGASMPSSPARGERRILTPELTERLLALKGQSPTLSTMTLAVF